MINISSLNMPLLNDSTEVGVDLRNQSLITFRSVLLAEEMMNEDTATNAARDLHVLRNILRYYGLSYWCDNIEYLEEYWRGMAYKYYQEENARKSWNNLLASVNWEEC